MKFTSLWKSAVLAGALALAGCAHTGPQGADHQECTGNACPASFYYTEFGMPDMPLAQLQAMASARLAVIGLEAVWHAPEGDAFRDVPEDRARLRDLLAVVLPAYERYPRTLLEKIRLRRLEFVKDLCVAGHFRQAMPALERDSVVYADIGERTAPASLEERVHHELYHFIEGRVFNDYYYRDPQWLALNPPGVKYGSGGRAAYGKLAADGTCVRASTPAGSAPGQRFINRVHPQAGMVSAYALYGPEEDKAEVFGWMMTPGYASRVKYWAEHDQALEAKRKFMTRLLYELSAGRLSAPDIDRLASRTRP